jgi:D-3-phosphoglycerate dehydrogenase / 2-oxoglutarate reductase
MNHHSLERKKIRVCLFEGIHRNAEEFFSQNGYENIEVFSGALEESELCKVIQDAHIIGIRSRTQITEKVLDHAKKLIAIGCFCIGTNQVDISAAKTRGIPVFNAPFSNTRSVAELVVAEAIMLLRGIPQKNTQVHNGIWKKSAASSFESRGKTLGIIGYGHIGTQVGILAEAFGMQVLYYDIENKLSLGNAVPAKNMEDLLKRSDVVTLHVPQTPQTNLLMNKKTLSLMKKGSFLINAARGTVIDIDALVESLDSKHILGAAIDVFPKEPATADEPFESPLKKYDNVLLTPHIGGSTLEAQENIGTEVSEKLVKYSDNGSTLFAVNFPQVSLPEHSQRSRILHVHKNIPGVLGNINRVFSEMNINISGQYLQTDEHIGYVVIDIDEDGKKALEKLKEVPGTIRTRILY